MASSTLDNSTRIKGMAKANSFGKTGGSTMEAGLKGSKAELVGTAANSSLGLNAEGSG
jgi:hypothetical protein